jgi:hypothetical protein
MIRSRWGLVTGFGVRGTLRDTGITRTDTVISHDRGRVGLQDAPTQL